MSGHTCEQCFMDSDDHSQECYEPEADCPQGRHWPALCCPGCPCHSYEDAHPMLHILQAMSDNDISYTWHGGQLRLHWWETGTRKRRLTRQERLNVLLAVKLGLAEHSPAYGRSQHGTFDLTYAGRKRLNQGRIDEPAT